MLTVLPGFPDGVVAVSAVGRVTRQDYEGTLIPHVAAAAQAHRKVRLYYEIGPEFASMEPAAMWEDFRVGVGYWTRWGRIAVVTEVPWIANLVNAFRFLMPGQIRVFPAGEKAAARAWLDGIDPEET